jgi:hypothetical protein
MTYLGTTLWADGSVKSEFTRRLGTAWAYFDILSRVWLHTSIPRALNVVIFRTIVTNVLLYGLSTAWMNASERRRLDRLQARCLRNILGIKPAYVSRISNKSVLETAKQTPYRTQLLKQQLGLYGQVARAPEHDVLKQLPFCPICFRPSADRYVRRVGGPLRESNSMSRPDA